MSRPHSAKARTNPRADKPTAHRCYTDLQDFLGERSFTVSRYEDPSDDRDWMHPIAVMDMSPEAHEARREMVARAMYDHSYNLNDKHPMIQKLMRGKAPAWEELTKTDNPFVDGLRAKADAILSALALSPKTKDTKP